MGQTAVRVRMDNLAQARLEFRWRIVERNAPKGAVLEKIQGTEACLTDLRGARKDRLEYRLQVARRRADHLEHVGGGGLALQRLAQLVEQPRIFYGDDGLGGKIADQFDLLVREGTNFLPKDNDCTDELAFLEHRNGDECADCAELDGSHASCIFVSESASPLSVFYVDRLFCGGQPAKTGIRPPDPRLVVIFGKCGRKIERRQPAKRAIGEFEHDTEFRVADPHRV